MPNVVRNAYIKGGGNIRRRRIVTVRCAQNDTVHCGEQIVRRRLNLPGGLITARIANPIK